jgi:hypothetical protein
MDATILQEEALSLCPLERARLADLLLNSLLSPKHQEKHEKAWGQVAENRLNEYRTGKMTSEDGPTVIAKLRASLKK